MHVQFLLYIEEPEWQVEFDLDEIAGYVTSHLYQKICRRKKLAIKKGDAPQDWVDLTGDHSGRLLMDILEAGHGVVSCPLCQMKYAAPVLLVFDESSCNISGRLVTCPQDHALLWTRERIGEAMDPMPPYVRRLRERPVTKASELRPNKSLHRTPAARLSGIVSQVRVAAAAGEFNR